MGIFAETAPKYWAAGIPAHPTKGKAAFIAGWSKFSDKMPTPQEQELWLQQFGEFNIGIVLGIQAGLCMIDIDTDDLRLQTAILSALPKSPWQRFGRKGMMLAYRYVGPEVDTKRIRGPNGDMIVERLASGVNVIVPPSIHPDTKAPYKENIPLYEIPRSEFPVMPADSDVAIKMALKEIGVHTVAPGSFKVSDFVPAGARDVALTSHAGILSRSVLRGERTYIEAVDEMTHWVQTFTAKVIGDEVSEEKGRAKLHEFFVRDAKSSKKALPIGWDTGLSEKQKKELGFDFDEAEEWEASRILEHFIRNHETILDPQDPAMMKLVEDVLVKINRSTSLSELETDRILKTVYEATGRAFTMTALRKQLKSLSKSEIEGTTHTEIAKAVYAQMSQYAQIRYWADRFYKWDGSYWKPMPVEVIHKVIQDDYSTLPAAKKFYDHKGIVSAMAMLASEDLQKVNRNGLNFANGFLAEDLQLLPHDPDYGMTYILPYCWEPDKAGHCPQFMRLLEDAWGQDSDYDQKVRCLREVMCATFMGLGPKYNRVLCLYGAAGSGKSQIMEVMRALMPIEAVSDVRPDSFGDRFNTCNLIGSLMNCCGEISENRSIAGDSFKSIVVGESIQIQYKGRDPFSYSPRATHWFSSNHLPKTKDTSAGFTRRWIFLEFGKKVPDDRKIQNFAQEIVSNEREAICAWAVSVMPELSLQSDYTLPVSHYKWVEELANSTNSVRLFLSQPELVRVGPDANINVAKDWISEKELHAAYFMFYVNTEGVRPEGLKKFREMMNSLKTELNFKNEIMKNPKTGAPDVIYKYVSLI